MTNRRVVIRDAPQNFRIATNNRRVTFSTYLKSVCNGIEHHQSVTASASCFENWPTMKSRSCDCRHSCSAFLYTHSNSRCLFEMTLFRPHNEWHQRECRTRAFSNRRCVKICATASSSINLRYSRLGLSLTLCASPWLAATESGALENRIGGTN